MTLGPRALFVFVTFPLFVTALQYHMVSVGLADMIDDLGAPLRLVGWVLTIFTVATAASQPIAGKLGEQFGSRLVFACGLGLFGLSSLGCALAPNIYVLIAGRLAQGIATGTISPTAYALVAGAFPTARVRAVGLVSSVIPIGTLVGPNLGGVLVDALGWRATMAVNVPIGIGLAVGALVLLPAGERSRRGAVDVRGAVLLAAAIFALVYGLTELGAEEPQVALVVLSMFAAVALTVVFLRHERRVAEPVIDLDLLRRRDFAITNLLNFTYGVALLGLFGFVPLYVQTVYDMSPTQSGLVLTPRAIAMVAVSTVAAILLPRTGYRTPIRLGLALQGIAAIVLSFSFRGVDVLGVAVGDLVWVSSVVTLIGIAYGLIGPPLNNAGIDLAP